MVTSINKDEELIGIIESMNIKIAQPYFIEPDVFGGLYSMIEMDEIKIRPSCYKYLKLDHSISIDVGVESFADHRDRRIAQFLTFEFNCITNKTRQQKNHTFCN